MATTFLAVPESSASMGPRISPRIFSMMATHRSAKWIWLVALATAAAFIWKVSALRAEQVRANSQLAGRAEVVDVIDPQSPTGYAHAQRELIVPERNEDSLHWIMQTQQMFAQHQWRVRQVNYDNAPEGRAVHAPSPYRWWLGLVSSCDHLLSGRPIGLSVEHAALAADPLLQLFFLVILSGFVAVNFGVWPASLFSLGFATLYPFAALFIAGEPDDRGLAASIALASLLVVAVALRRGFSTPTSGAGPSWESNLRRWFTASGVIAALALWVSVPIEIPIIAGTFLGGVFLAIRWRAKPGLTAETLLPPWRLWASSGAIVTVIAYLIEYFPGHLRPINIEFIHPLYALAWLGLGELLTRVSFGLGRGIWPRKPIEFGIWFLALATLVPIPVLMKTTETRGFLGLDLLALRLSKLPGSPIANSLWAWLLHDGPSTLLLLTLAPLFIALVGWIWMRPNKYNQNSRFIILFLLGPLILAVGYAASELTYWSLVEVVILAIIVTTASALEPTWKSLRFWVVNIVVLGVLIAGGLALWPRNHSSTEATLTSADAQTLIERDLAHWLSKRSGGEGAVVLASPRVTMTQCFFGNLRGIGTINTDNRGGLGATIAAISVTNMDEAQTLLEKRGVKYLIIPSWDNFFEDYINSYLARQFRSWQPFFIPELRRWHLPPWLRPIPYDPPKIGGFESQSVLIFEVVDPQNPAVAMSRLAEYMIETGDLDQASRLGDELRRFPGDLGALAARAQVANAKSDGPELEQIMSSLSTRLSSGADRYLLWDRRVSLAIVLARSQKLDWARTETKRCIDELNIKQARGLSTGLLYNLLVIAQSLDLPIRDAGLRENILNLLPPDLQTHL